MTAILGRPLMHIDIRPQVSFAVAPCRLCKPSSVSNFSNVEHSEKDVLPELKNVLAAVSRAETPVDGRGRPRTTEGKRRFDAARPYALNSSFCYSLRVFSISRCIYSREPYLQNTILNRDRCAGTRHSTQGGRRATNQHNNQLVRGHTQQCTHPGG